MVIMDTTTLVGGPVELPCVKFSRSLREVHADRNAVEYKSSNFRGKIHLAQVVQEMRLEFRTLML